MANAEFLTVIGVTSIIEAIGLYNLRSEGITTLVIGMLAYGFGVAPFLRYATNYEGIGMVNFLWNVCSTLLGFTIGIFLYGEKVQGMKLIGVFLSLLGLGLIVMAPDSKHNK